MAVGVFVGTQMQGLLDDFMSLRGPDASGFFLSHHTSRIFDADGVTAVSAPGTAVSLAADDWQGLTLGAEQVATAYTSIWSASGAGLVTASTLEMSAATDGQTITSASFGAVTDKLVAVQFEVFDLSAGSVSLRAGNGGVTDYTASANGLHRHAGVFDGNQLNFRGNGAGNTWKIRNVSVREILNWPAYQNTVAARPTWGRAPAQVRNLISNTDLSGAVAGTPGTPPTGWSNVIQSNGSLSAVAATGDQGGNRVTLTAAAGYAYIESPQVTFAAGDVRTASARVRVQSGTVEARHVVSWVSYLGAATLAWKVNGVAQAGTFVLPVGQDVTVEATLTAVNAGTSRERIGAGENATSVLTATVEVWAPQAEAGSAHTAYQRRGPNPTDITETGVTSFGLLSFDGSDDALLHQLAAGGTVAVALFGRGGSYLIPSITLAAPSVLQLGPLSVLDDGVLVSGCPTGILRAVGTVPWSSRFELVGYAIMKANPSAEEQARAMRYFAAHGARGWLVEGPELIVNGDFASPAGWTLGAGWSVGSGVATKVAGTASDLERPVAVTAGVSYIMRFDMTRTAGFLRGRFLSGTSVQSSPYSAASASVVEILTAAAGNANFGAFGDINFAGTVDNVSLRALTPEF